MRHPECPSNYELPAAATVAVTACTSHYYSAMCSGSNSQQQLLQRTKRTTLTTTILTTTTLTTMRLLPWSEEGTSRQAKNVSAKINLQTCNEIEIQDAQSLRIPITMNIIAARLEMILIGCFFPVLLYQISRVS